MPCQTARCLQTKPCPYQLLTLFLGFGMIYRCLQCISVVIYMYLVPTSSRSMLCDVASRILIADIICLQQSLFHRLHNNSWALGCQQYRLAFNNPPPWNNEVLGSPVFTLALMICNTKYRYATTDGKRRLIQIQTRVSNQQLTHLVLCWHYKFNSSSLFVQSVQLAVIPTVLLSLLV